MKAAIWTKYGPPEVLEIHEVATPRPKANQVLVKIAAANVFPGDCELRKFQIHPLFWLPLRLYAGIFKPRIKVLGQEFAGEVVAVGDKVTDISVGDRVFAPTSGFGAYAEYIATTPKLAVAIPDNISVEEAAAAAVGGLNALHFLRVGKVGPGHKVLLYGAGGSIGTMAIQIAKVMGAEVTAVDSGHKLATLSAFGADHTIDYTKEDFTRNGETWDVVVDFPGKSRFSQTLRSIKRGGYYVHGNGSTWTMMRRLWASRLSGRNVRIALAGYNREDLEYIAALMAAGKLQPVINRRYPLDEIVEAHRYVETGEKTGNVVVVT